MSFLAKSTSALRKLQGVSPLESQKALGALIGKSVSAYRRFLDECTAAGYFRPFVFALDPQKVGFRIVGIFELQFADLETAKAAERILIDTAAVTEVYADFGGCEFVLKVRTRTQEELVEYQRTMSRLEGLQLLKLKILATKKETTLLPL